MSQIKKKNQEFVDVNQPVDSTLPNQNFGYWKSLKDISSSEDYDKFLKQSDHNEDTNISRRNFMSLIAASVALAGLEGCKKPVQKIIPYVEAKRNTIPGIPKYYSTTMPFKNNAFGLVVENHDERPIKIEGNALHSITGGKSNVYVQSSTLNMYDPDRARGVKLKGKKIEWTKYLESIQSLKDNVDSKVAILSGESSSLSVKKIKKDFLKKFPNSSWTIYEPISNENVLLGIEAAFGKKYQPIYNFDKAQIVLSVGSDFLGVDDNSIYNTRTFSSKRNLENENSEMNRLYVAESSMSVTGSSADHRLNIRASEYHNLLVELAHELKQLGMKIEVNAKKSTNNLWIKTVAEDLYVNRKKCIVIGGDSLGAESHELIATINFLLGSNIDYYPSENTSSISDLQVLCQKIKNKEVDTLFILGANPVYDAPADLDFGNLIDLVPNTVHLSNYYDETSKKCDWHIAESHYLETWGDACSIDGYLSIIQPQIQPLFNSKNLINVLSLLVYGEDISSYEFVKNNWKEILASSNFNRSWEKVLHDGFYAKQYVSPVKISRKSSKSYSSQNVQNQDSFELVFTPSPTVYDGRFSNNGWLQELPKPISHLTWDNAAFISLKLAKELKVRNGQLLRIKSSDSIIEIPVWILPGQNSKTITVELGYGREFSGRIGSGVGFNVYPLRKTDTMHLISGIEMEVLNKNYPLAGTQDHYGLEEDHKAAPGFSSLSSDAIQSRIPEIVKQTTLDEYKKHPDFVIDAVKEHLPDKKRSLADHSMYNPEKEYDYSKGPQWGMSIDLTSCTGCNACSIACQSENNIPVVGKQQVMNGREMHWIRIDNYFSGDPDNPEVSTQSVACVHCELAPCEQVCPVAATTHSTDGVNQMTYNRCLGTRYCANNCPYKVRKFNFYNYTRDLPEVVQMAMNPDVSVRFRGVMEKCTYCYQRVTEARITANKENRDIIDGEIKVACQQSCPADAIKFGDINDPNSEVSKAKKRNRDYALLGQLGTSPRTTYLAKIRNQNPKLVSSHSTKGHH